MLERSVAPSGDNGQASTAVGSVVAPNSPHLSGSPRSHLESRNDLAIRTTVCPVPDLVHPSTFLTTHATFSFHHLLEGCVSGAGSDLYQWRDSHMGGESLCTLSQQRVEALFVLFAEGRSIN